MYPSLLIVIIFFIVSLDLFASDNQSFERNFQKIGKKIDQAAKKGKELGSTIGKEAKEGLQEVKETAQEIKERPWKDRITSAFNDLGSGIKNAWASLTGKKDRN